jgi:hypothetical protein
VYANEMGFLSIIIMVANSLGLFVLLPLIRSLEETGGHRTNQLSRSNIRRVIYCYILSLKILLGT